MTKAPWLDLEMPARAYCGGNFVARLLNDSNGGRRPRPRGARARTAGSAPKVNDECAMPKTTWWYHLG